MKKLLFSILFAGCIGTATAQVQINREVQMNGAGVDDRKVTGLSAASAVTTPVATDAVSNATIQSNWLTYKLATGAVNAYAVTLVPAVASYQTGMIVNFRANAANTGAATLNVNGLGAIPIRKLVTTALSPNDIMINQMVTVMYDGTNFQLMSGVGSSRMQTFHVRGTASRTAVASTTLTLQPGVTQTFTIPAGVTADVYINATIGMRNVSTTASQYAAVDAVLHVNGVAMAAGGWNRITNVNHGTGNSLTNVSLASAVVLAGGTHTIDMRTARVNGNTTVDIGGDALLDTTAGEMTIFIFYR
ncbi:MAG: hypothetical protein EAZ57_01285 [Cytophagales bacterium]|nr:MAG: hypothetical protein EAZ67_01990 [Cytophagales bacterium]TAF62083.1 MAG: hypothetical protein EAZ57_01285 [Cytophagales bacterium]